MTSGRITCIRDQSASLALARAFEVRDAGGVPLIGDIRWSDAHWQRLRASFDGLEAPGDTAWATLTSGSTGAPRVVLRGAASWERSFAPLTDLVGLRASDVVALPVSVVSSMTVFQAAHARRVGADVVVPAARHNRIDDAALRRATVVHATPLLLADIVARLEADRAQGVPHAMRVAVIGGDALSATLRARTEALGVRVVAYAGAAELSFVAVDTDGTGLRPFPGVDVSTDADDVLWARSPFAASGYAGGAPGPLRTVDGWATVGDRATLDADGDGCGPRITMLGRSDGAILTAGATVIPEDAEAAIRTIDGIADAAVTGVTVSRIGRLVAVLAVPADGDRAAFDVAAARRAAADRLPRSHQPRRWVIADELPRTLSGKLDRAAVDRIVAGTMTGSVS